MSQMRRGETIGALLYTLYNYAWETRAELLLLELLLIDKVGSITRARGRMQAR